MKRIQFLFIVLTLLIFVGCSTSTTTTTTGIDSTSKAANVPAPESPKGQEVDLAQYGIPVKLTVPEGAKVEKGLLDDDIEGSRLVDVDIAANHFLLNVMLFDEETDETPAEAIRASKQAEAEDENFKGFLVEEPNGYIVKTSIDGQMDYIFHYILEKDGRHIEFSQGIMADNFSEAEIRALYDAAKAAH